MDFEDFDERDERKKRDKRFLYPPNFWVYVSVRLGSYVVSDNFDRGKQALNTFYKVLRICYYDPDKQVKIPQKDFDGFMKYYRGLHEYTGKEPPSVWQLTKIERIQTASEDDPDTVRREDLEKNVFIHGFRDMKDGSKTKGQEVTNLDPFAWSNLYCQTLLRLEEYMTRIELIMQKALEKNLTMMQYEAAVAEITQYDQDWRTEEEKKEYGG